MAKKPGLTKEQWLADLESALNRRDTVEGLSTADLAERLGVCQATARIKVKRAVAAGRWEMKGQRAQAGMAGRTCLVPVYGPVGGKGCKRG